ncbi:Heparanase-like protein 3 [Platanthera guangdongensis]|uniref:Heparanase-like protein 3 n=1 Tax=Platanthera guangdongensis TaxID=2320717 RepID=A0ABR2LUC2_9ASPA
MTQVIFGLNALNGRVPMQDGSLGGPWNHKSVKSLILYNVMKGYNIFGWELGMKLNYVLLSALLWHPLMGPKVLSTDFIGMKKIRVYSHCSKHSEGITLLLLNLDKEEYHLTAKDGNLHSQTVLLNGIALNLNSKGGISALKPNRVDGSPPIKLAPLSIVFAHLPNFLALACM